MLKKTKRREKVLIQKNTADALVFQTEKNLKEYGEKISEEDKSKIETDLKELKDSLEKDDLDIIKEKSEALTQSSMKMGEAMYKDQQGQQPEGDPGDASANPDSKDGEKKR